MATRSNYVDGNRIKTHDVENKDDVVELMNLFPLQMLTNYELLGLIRFVRRNIDCELLNTILYEAVRRLDEKDDYVRIPEECERKFEIGDLVEVRQERRIFKDWFHKTDMWVPATIIGFLDSDRHARYRIKYLRTGDEGSGYGTFEADLRLAVNPCVD